MTTISNPPREREVGKGEWVGLQWIVMLTPENIVVLSATLVLVQNSLFSYRQNFSEDLAAPK